MKRGGMQGDEIGGGALCSAGICAAGRAAFAAVQPLFAAVSHQQLGGNAFFTVGRGMLAGKLPYRDFALSAGPLARLAERLWSRRRTWGGVLAVAAAVCVGFNCLTNGNLPYIGYPAEELP